MNQNGHHYHRHSGICILISTVLPTFLEMGQRTIFQMFAIFQNEYFTIKDLIQLKKICTNWPQNSWYFCHPPP